MSATWRPLTSSEHEVGLAGCELADGPAPTSLRLTGFDARTRIEFYQIELTYRRKL